MNAPKVSVLVPTYNYARFLPEAIESILAQECTDFELIIADDASTDESAAILRSYAQRDSRIRVFVHSSNIGMVNNWNFCLQQARGEFVKYVFGDDRLVGPKSLERYIALLETNPSAILAASARVVIDEKSRVLDLYRDIADGLHNGREVINLVLEAGGKNRVGEPSAVLFRKKDVPNGFPTRYRQVVDVEMWFEMLEKGSLIYTGEPLCAFRIHGRQATAENTDNGIAHREYAEFFSTYVVRPEIPPQAVLPTLYNLRRMHDADGQRKLLKKLGAGWLFSYCLYCIRYRLTKPFLNAAHSLQKRSFRRQYPTISSWDASS